MIAELAETIRDLINTNAVTVLTPYTDLVAECAFDPSQCFEGDKLGLYVVPMMNGISVADSGRRERLKAIVTTPTIAIVLSRPFETSTPGDVAQWTEVKTMMQVRESIDIFLARQTYSGYTIVDINVEPAMEVAVNKKWFCALSEFTFQGQTC